jgi:hypothetical protein
MQPHFLGWPFGGLDLNNPKEAEVMALILGGAIAHGLAGPASIVSVATLISAPAIIPAGVADTLLALPALMC